jgi:hypothetical protein
LTLRLDKVGDLDGVVGENPETAPGLGTGETVDQGAVPAEAVLGVDDTLQHVRSRLPADVTLTNPLHPLVGRPVRADRAHRWNGDVWLVVMLPDGYPGRVPVGDTDLLGGRPRLGAGTTVLSVAGIRGLHRIVVRCGERASAVAQP